MKIYIIIFLHFEKGSTVNSCTLSTSKQTTEESDDKENDEEASLEGNISQEEQENALLKNGGSIFDDDLP